MTTGFLLRLSPSSWGFIDKKARNAVRKAQKNLIVREGKLEELQLLHWNPIYLPNSLGSNQRIYTAIYDSQPVACILVTFILGEKKIKYSFAGGDDAYRELNGNSLLIWHVAEQFMNDNRYLYFDLGGSAKKNIARFKAQFATETYEEKPSRSFYSSIRFRLTKWLPYRLNRLSQPGGRLQRVNQMLQLHDVRKHAEGNRIVHIGCDDVNLNLQTNKTQIQPFVELHESYPKFHVTFFTVPWKLEESKDIVDILREDWVNVGLHSFRHSNSEIWDKLSEQRVNDLLHSGLNEMEKVNIKPIVFKPPKYRSNPSLKKSLKSLGIRNAFLSNDQFQKLTTESTMVRNEFGLNLYPTNYSIWIKDPRRLETILKSNGYLSIQTHTADIPKRSKNLWWILGVLEKFGSYRFEDFHINLEKQDN